MHLIGCLDGLANVAFKWIFEGALKEGLKIDREFTGHYPAYPQGKLYSSSSFFYRALDAIRFHTVGSVSWGRLGRALYMADYLEPGRKFSRADRAYLAAQVPHDFDATFRQVVRARLEWSLREGMRLYPEAVVLWNAVR